MKHLLAAAQPNGRNIQKLCSHGYRYTRMFSHRMAASAYEVDTEMDAGYSVGPGRGNQQSSLLVDHEGGLHDSFTTWYNFWITSTQKYSFVTKSIKQL